MVCRGCILTSLRIQYWGGSCLFSIMFWVHDARICIGNSTDVFWALSRNTISCTRLKSALLQLGPNKEQGLGGRGNYMLEKKKKKTGKVLSAAAQKNADTCWPTYSYPLATQFSHLWLASPWSQSWNKRAVIVLKVHAIIHDVSLCIRYVHLRQ